jgi:peptidoglycan/xylan/chitin deacetylase (PgdA/CDA1 family)
VVKRVGVAILSRILLRSGMLRLLDRWAGTLPVGRASAECRRGPGGRRRANHLTILVYHRVNDERDPFFPATPIGAFTAQMEYLASRFNVCRLVEGVERLRTASLPERALAITFDDGYRDNYLNAFPVLARLGLPATILLATGAIGSDRVLWHDRVFAAFRETKRALLEGFGTAQGYRLGSVPEKLAAQRAVLRHLWRLADDVRAREIDRLVQALGVDDTTSSPGLMLSWDDVRAMHGDGIEFGAHTVSHPVLSTVSPDRAVEEVTGCKQRLEDALGVPVRTFAYPVGRRDDFTPGTKELLRRTGYTCALSTVPGVNRSGQDLFELRRLSPWDEDVARFGARLTFDRMFR